MTRVLLADDQAMVRSGLRMILELADLDVRMPGTDGIEATRRIVAAELPCRVLILTTFDLDQHVYDALTAGAAGFLLKDASAAQLVGAVERTTAGETPMAPQVLGRLIDRFLQRQPAGQPEADRLASLSSREREVLGLIAIGLMAIGLTNPEIADRLVVSVATVKTHVRSILAKLDARDRVQVVLIAHQYGLVAD